MFVQPDIGSVCILNNVLTDSRHADNLKSCRTITNITQKWNHYNEFVFIFSILAGVLFCQPVYLYIWSNKYVCMSFLLSIHSVDCALCIVRLTC